MDGCRRITDGHPFRDGAQGCGNGGLVTGGHVQQLSHGCHDTFRAGGQQVRAGVLAQQADGESVPAGGEGIAFAVRSELRGVVGLDLFIDCCQSCGGGLVLGVEAFLPCFHAGNLGFQGSKFLCGGAVASGAVGLVVVQAANFRFGRLDPAPRRSHFPGEAGQRLTPVRSGTQQFAHTRLLRADGRLGVVLDLHGSFEAVAALLQRKVQLSLFAAQPGSLFGQLVGVAAGVMDGVGAAQVALAFGGQCAQGAQLLAGGAQLVPIVPGSVEHGRGCGALLFKIGLLAPIAE